MASSARTATELPPAAPPRHAWWPFAKRLGGAAFLALVAWLIARQARLVHWDEVWQAVLDYPAWTLLGAGSLAAVSHLLYASFDLLSRRHVRHTLPARRVLTTAFISYAFNLNFGSLIGGVALRFRLYARQGLRAEPISRLVGFSMLTNWLGYLVLVGAMSAWQPIEVPEAWALGSHALRVLGSALIALAVLYLGACLWSRKRSFALRGQAFTLPSGRLALLQLGASMLNWALMGAIIFLLLPSPQVGYAAALATLLAAAIAGVMAHVPAGLGVLEAVFIAMLSPPLAQSPLLAALLVYRAVYYLLPLAVAAVLYLVLEFRLRKAP